MALIGSGLVVMAQFALFLVIGLALWQFYGTRVFDRTDEIFVTFIIEELPPGVTGLVLASIFAAAMSSLSSSLNSLASASTYDFYAAARPRTDAELFRMGRVFTLVWAVVLVGGALLFRSRDTPVVELGLAIQSFTYGGLLGGFFLAVLHPTIRERDAIGAIGAGMFLMSIVVFARWYAALAGAVGAGALADALLAVGSIAWPWHVVMGTLLTYGTGSLLALRR